MSRTSVPEMDALLNKEFPVLDHGFIRVVDYMGDDSAIVQAARVSYGSGTKTVNEDQGLINYLMRHRHSTPFEMCEIKIHVKIPIFVARQWIRHRTANVNEYSARYSILDKEFYTPKPEHIAMQSTLNNQGRGAILGTAEAKSVVQRIGDHSEDAYALYESLLESDGISRELARMTLPVNYYTQWYWKTNLHNLMNFISLRSHSHAQYEIRVYADVLLEIMRSWVPFTHEAYVNFREEGVNFSGKALSVVRRVLCGEEVTQESSGLPLREWREFITILQPTLKESKPFRQLGFHDRKLKL